MEPVLREGRRYQQVQTLGAFIEEEIESSFTKTSKGLHSKEKHKNGVHKHKPFGKAYTDPTTGSRTKEIIPPISSAKVLKSMRESKTCHDDEIIRHMSNLPSFLQQTQKTNTVQDKALNFGVLDWKRLEKYKYNEPVHQDKKTLSPKGSPLCTAMPKSAKTLKVQPSAHGVDTVLLSSGKPISQDLRFNTPQNLSSLTHSSHVKKECVSIARGKEDKYVKHLKFKDKETWLEEFEAAQKLVNPRKLDGNLGRVDLHDRNTYERDVNNHVAVADNPKEVVNSEIEGSSPERNDNKFSFFSRDITSSRRLDKETRSNDEVDTISNYCRMDEQLVRLALQDPDPPNRSRNISEVPQFKEFRTSFDAQCSEISFSDYFASEGLCSNIPHSCPMSSVTTANAESLTKPPLNSLRGKSRRHSFSIESSNRAQDADSEHSNVKGIEPSPSRRFSFSFGRLSRSSSCKESSTYPQLSYGDTGNKSGPLMPEPALDKDDVERGKANVSGRRRSSPLRRLLDPLIKHRSGKSTETVQTTNVNSDTGTHRTLCSEGQSHDRKSEGSTTIQALLQVTLKNGFPFFKLVDDNSKDMLAAVIKKSPVTSGKTDLRAVYLFYSVHEIKKKSISWMGQGSKNRNCSLGYKILGQMKISNNCNVYASEDSSVARECVLYGVVDPAQDDKQISEFSLGQEIAALVVRDSTQKSCGRATSDGVKYPDDAIIILPGGVHGTPIKGAHSSLISRWRSGGSCDCGGWDIGCKLRILANDRRKIISRTHDASSASHSNVGRVDLYTQGTTAHSKAKPVFSLEPLNNGLYSMKLDQSISLLEAFATCVALVTCREFSEMLDVRDMSETVNCREANGNDKKTEAKYFSNLPLSPAGRI